MNKSFDLSKLFKLFALSAVAIIIIAVLLLIVVGGNTHDIYADGNLDIIFFVKAFISVVLAGGLVTLYFGARFRRRGGLKAGLITTFSAFVSALCSFCICVIFRAPLCGYVFSVMLLAIFVSVICSVINFDCLNSYARKSKKNNEDTTAPSTLALRRLLLFFLLIVVILMVAFVSALILDAHMLTFYAFPAVVTVIFSGLFTLSACGKLFDK